MAFKNFTSWPLKYLSVFQDVLSLSSSVLSSVLAGQAYFHSFSILLPRSWRGYLDAEEATGLSSRQPDVIVMKNGHTRQRSPYVEHSRGRDEWVHPSKDKRPPMNHRVPIDESETSFPHWPIGSQLGLWLAKKMLQTDWLPPSPWLTQAMTKVCLWNMD